jgi:hypothetical protein
MEDGRESKIRTEAISSKLTKKANHKHLRKLLAKKNGLKKYDEELEGLTEKIWESEYLSV